MILGRLLNALKTRSVLGTRPAKTPIEDNYKEEMENEPWPDVKQYQRLVGKLIYLTITRPDICFAVNQVSKHMQAPTLHHWHMVERILRYLKMNPGKGIWFNNNQRTDLVGYCDADWAGDRHDRKSTTGYCTFIGGNLVTWKTKKQKVVSLSSAEAEYRAMKEVTKELIWLRELLRDLGVRSDQPITLHCDNKAALHIASNPVFHERTKHIEVDCHFVREKVQDGTIQTSFVRSEEQYADIFTKAATSQVCDYIHGKIGLRDLHQPILRRSVKQTNDQLAPKDELPREVCQREYVTGCEDCNQTKEMSNKKYKEPLGYRQKECCSQEGRERGQPHKYKEVHCESDMSMERERHKNQILPF